jgi:hypothetical protein
MADDPIAPTVFPTELFQLTGNVCTVQEVLDQLAPLNLKWQVENDPENNRRRAIAPLYIDPVSKEIWAVATVERWSSPRHLHNAGGIYGELVITLAGSLDDITDGGQPVKCVPGTAIWHAGNTVHQATGDFWAGIYHQPRGSSPRPLAE